jgi:hypothetical protein
MYDVYVESETAVYFYDAESLAPANGITVLVPDSINPLNPGRWRLQKADLSSISSAIMLQGTWNANTNAPDLTILTPPKGYAWYVTVAGATNLGGITSWTEGDLAVSTGGGNWIKIDGISTVLSVNGQAGVVLLDTDDIPEGVINLYYTDVRAAAAAPVQSVNTRTGAVVLTLADTPWAVVFKAVSYVAVFGEYVVTTAAGVVISLPPAPAIGDTGKSVAVKRIHAGAMSSASGNGNTIDGAAVYTMLNRYDEAEFVWSGTEWGVS